MPTRNINLTPEADEYVAQRIATGVYANASEVVRAGLRALQQQEELYAARLARLEDALDAGDASPDAVPGTFERVRLRIRRRAEALGISDVA